MLVSSFKVKTATFKFFKTFLVCIFEWEITGKNIQWNCFLKQTVVTEPVKIKAFPENSSAYFTFSLTVF